MRINRSGKMPPNPLSQPLPLFPKKPHEEPLLPPHKNSKRRIGNIFPIPLLLLPQHDVDDTLSIIKPPKDL